MNDVTDHPAPVPGPTAETVPSVETKNPATSRRAAVLLCVGGAAGLALGVLLTTGVFASYTYFTHTLPSTRDSVQVFNELNELRQQINQLNEGAKLKELEKVESVRQALGAVAPSSDRMPDSGAPAAPPSPKKQGGGGEPPPAAKAQGPFAELDAEIERLEQTQKVLNTILDVFTRKGKESAKDR